MSLGNSSVHQSGEIPEITKLPNGRIRVVRRFAKFTREDVDNVNLGSLLGDFGDLDATGEQVTNQGYSNCRLIEVEVDTSTKRSAGSDSSSSVLVQTYETLTDSFVEITDPTISFTENGLKQVTRVYRAVSGTTSSKVVGTATLPVVPVEGTTTTYLASSQVEDNTALAELTEVYLESGVLSISESHRYGDSVEVYSVEGIKLTEAQARAAISGLPATAKFYGSRLSNYEGLQTTVYEFFTGSGVISTQISQSYNDKLTRTTIVSIDDVPVTPVGAVLIESKAEARDEFILYTYVFVKGVGVISTETSHKYVDTLDVVTVTAINQVPSVPAGAFTKEALVRQEDGYLLYSTTYVSGKGEIGRSTESKYGSVLSIVSVTSINEVPSETGALINTSVQEGDYGTVYTYTYASGSGEIGSSVDTKYGGKLTLTTKTSLNLVPTGTGATISSGLRETDYGTIYTYVFANGEGDIGENTDTKYGGKLTVTTKTSLNTVPTGTGVTISSGSTETDYGTIHTYVFADGEGEIGESEDLKYDGTLSLITKVSLNQVPTNSGYLFKTDSRETDYGTIYTYTWADGKGEIGESADERYQGKLKIKTITSLNEIPTTPANFTSIGTSQDSGDFGIVYTYRYASGEGEISNTEQTRGDGSIVNSYTILGGTAPTPASGSYLMEESYDAADGYDIYTYYYYRLPEDYEVPVSTTWTKPATLDWSREDGFYIDELGSVDPVTGTAEVVFSATAPSAIALADVDVSCWTRENAKYKDGTRLVRSGTFSNTVSGGAGGSGNNGDYLGDEVSALSCSSGGPDMPSGSIVVGWETVPYFYAGGSTIYKTTTTRVSV